MLRHSFLIYICLLSAPSFFCNGNHIHGPLTSPRKFTRQSSLASERRGDTFAVVDYQQHTYYSNYNNKIVINMNLRIENWKNQSIKECSYSLELNKYKYNYFYIKSFERLKSTDDKVVLLWGDLKRRTEAFVMDFRTCFIMFLGPKDVDSELFAVPTRDGGLDLFVKHDFFCKDAGNSCVIRYDSSLRVVGRPKPFGADSDFDTLHADRLRNGNLLVLSPDNSHRFNNVVMFDSSTGHQKYLLSLNYKTFINFKLISSGSSFCWMFHPLREKTIHCSQFDDKGELMFNNSVKFDLYVEPVFMRELADDELFVLNYVSQYLEDGGIWTLRWAKVLQHSGEMVDGYVQFNCTGRILLDTFLVYDIWQSGERTHLGYACQNGDRYVYDVTSF